MNIRHTYKGSTIEVAKNQFGYILIIDGVDISYQHISESDAVKEGREFIDSRFSEGNTEIGYFGIK